MNDEDILKLPVKERTNEQHQQIIRHIHDGDVRGYLLSMGQFKGGLSDKQQLIEEDDTAPIIPFYFEKDLTPVLKELIEYFRDYYPGKDNEDFSDHYNHIMGLFGTKLMGELR